jgi:UDP-N-acetylmuramoylalanine--D-glutamate ligase
VAVAGNVGAPVASLVGEIPAEATVACECSSFQLEDAEAFAPECAVLLNVTPDHLDRHHDFEDYLRAKLRIFANQGNDDVAVFNASDPALRDRDLGGCARRVAYCRGADPDCEVSLNDGVLFAGSEPLMDAAELSLPGPHNADNAMAAAAAALAMGIAPEAVREGLRTFPGIPHRLERVAEVDGVLYVNDSKATNVAAAAAALRSFDGGVHAILGGSLKGGGFEGLAAAIAERCVACYLIGEAAEALERDLQPAREAGVRLVGSGDLAQAVREAARAAGPGEVVLLAPACASFDAYRDFEERGEHFRSLVEELSG